MIERQVAETVRQYGMFRREADGGTVKVLCAVSGGADSMAILTVLSRLESELGIKVAAAHFNHRLRGAESDSDARFVKDYCASAGVRLYAGTGDVSAFSAENKMGVEQAAREMRYAFLNETLALSGSKWIATAHNSNDNVETVIMNLTRGAGLSGLRGIPPVRGNIARPLLYVTREEILRYLEERGVPHVEDSTNGDTAYTRNKIRANVAPVLYEINPGLCQAVSSMTRLLRSDGDFIASHVNLALMSAREAHGGIAVDTELLKSLHPAVATRLVRALFQLASGEGDDGLGERHSELGIQHTSDVLELLRSKSPSARLEFSGVTVRRVYGDLVFGRNGNVELAPVSLPLDLPGRLLLPDAGFEIFCRHAEPCEEINNSFNSFYIDCGKIKGALSVRGRKSGDSMQLFGRNVTKSLKKLFIEEKLPSSVREGWPVIADDEGVIAVCGFGPNAAKLAAAAENALNITIDNINAPRDSGRL